MKKYNDLEEFLQDYYKSPEWYNMLTPIQSIQEIGHIYRPVFQSLFLWNIYFNFGQPNLLVVVRICFNPYFYGTSTSTSTAEEAEKRKKECFNPYFYGTSTSTNTRH